MSDMTMHEIERTDKHNRNGLEAWIERTPPFDCLLGMCRVADCPTGPDLGGRSHGRGTARYRWILRGEGLAVQFMWFADEHLPETVDHMNATMPNWNRPIGGRPLYPMAADLGYHAATPMWPDQDQMDDCDLLGIPCYYDGSGFAAEVGLKLLGTDGPEAVWAWLEAYWHERFSELMASTSHKRNTA